MKPIQKGKPKSIKSTKKHKTERWHDHQQIRKRRFGGDNGCKRLHQGSQQTIKWYIDPTELHTDSIKAVVNNSKDAEQISSKMANSLLLDKVKIQAFYLLPKIHKYSNPGTPVISSGDCHTSRISQFVDHYLQPAMSNLKLYVKETRLISLRK